MRYLITFTEFKLYRFESVQLMRTVPSIENPTKNLVEISPNDYFSINLPTNEIFLNGQSELKTPLVVPLVYARV